MDLRQAKNDPLRLIGLLLLSFAISVGLILIGMGILIGRCFT